MIPDNIKVCVMCEETIKGDTAYFEVNNRCVCDECAMCNDFHRVAAALGIMLNENESIVADYTVGEGEIIDVPEAEILKVEEA